MTGKDEVTRWPSHSMTGVLREGHKQTQATRRAGARGPQTHRPLDGQGLEGHRHSHVMGTGGRDAYRPCDRGGRAADTPTTGLAGAGGPQSEASDRGGRAADRPWRWGGAGGAGRAAGSLEPSRWWGPCRRLHFFFY